MSVINQMLRDLDARDASGNERAGLPQRLRPLPPALGARRQGWQMLAAGIAIGAVVAGGLVALMQGPGTPPAPLPQRPQPPQPAPSATTIPPAAAVPPAPTFAAEPPPASIEAGEMKLSTLLASGKASIAPPPLPPVKAAAAPAKPAAAKPEEKPGDQATAQSAEKPAEKPAEKTVAKPAEPTEPTTAGRIDKRSKDEARDLAEAEYRKGMQAVKRGDNNVAAPLFARALEFDPAAHKARQALLSVLVGGKRWGDAQQAAQAGLDLDPTQSGWATIIARLQFEQGDTAGAVQTLERYAVHAPHDADYQGLFAYLLQKQARPAEAAQRFKLALQSRPNEGRWWFGLGLALEQSGQAGESKEAYAKALQTGNLPADMAKVVEQKLKSP